MDWSFAEVISYASRGVTLTPGDVFGSGTVPTCTLVEHLDPTAPESFRGWLHDGDVVTLRVEGLGETRQTVRTTAAPHPLSPRPNPDAAAGRAAGQPGAGEGALHPRAARGRRPGVGLDAAGRRVTAGATPGLVAGDGASLLVDTLFDLALTREMLAAMEPITDRRTDHRCVDHPLQRRPHARQPAARRVGADHRRDGHRRGDRARHGARDAGHGADRRPRARSRRHTRENASGTSTSAASRCATPTRPSTTELTIEVGGRQVELLNLGPAHTAADSVVHVPDAGVLFAGDLLFIGCTPIVWAGPIANWVAACDAMIALDAPTVVPGPRSGHRSGRNPCGAWLSRPRRRAGRSRLSQGPVVRGGRRHHRPRRVRDLAGRRARRRSTSTSAIANSIPTHRNCLRWACW